MSFARWSLLLLSGLGTLPGTTAAHADVGQPVAVSWWGQGMVSIETVWNLTVVLDPFSMEVGYDDPRLTADLVLVTHEHADHNHVELVEGEPTIVRGLDEQGKVRAVDSVLDRFPGEAKPTWRDARLRIARSPHAIHVTSIPAWHDNEQGKQRGATAMFVMEVDGVRIAHCGDLGQHKLTEDQLQKLGRVDVLLLAVGGIYTLDGNLAAELVRTIKPRVVVPLHYKTPALKFDLQPVNLFLSALDDAEIVRPEGNTLAIRAAEGNNSAKPKVVVLDYEPWQMPADMAMLFVAKEKACGAAQEVFAPLNTAQMNFKPSNGTHTPRWNAEHMMGRELGFFSQIYAALDPQIAHLDLNPKQMPPDYRAAHPEWTGAEEARQMERVSSFTRRFAYLLDELPLDEQSPGSRWTLRGLLAQMERHYNQHTANVRKKIELPDWPGE